MATRIGSRRRKTRHLFTQSLRSKGKIPLSIYFQEFTAKDKVALIINPGVKKGQFFRRFYGMTGTITGQKKGRCYEIIIKDGGKQKLLYVHPIHLKKQ